MKNRNDTGEFIFRAVTHALLGIITFLAVEIYGFMRDAFKTLENHETRISVLESKVK